MTLPQCFFLRNATVIFLIRPRGGWKCRQSHQTETAPLHLLITFLGFLDFQRRTFCLQFMLKTFQVLPMLQLYIYKEDKAKESLACGHGFCSTCLANKQDPSPSPSKGTLLRGLCGISNVAIPHILLLVPTYGV